MKKILLVATVQSHIAQFHNPFIKMLKDKGYEVDVAAKNNLEEKDGIQIEGANKIYDLNFSRNPISKNNISAYKKLKKIIYENNYDIIECNTPVGGVLSRLAARKLRETSNNQPGGQLKRIKVIYMAHGFHFYKGAPLKNWIFYYPIEKMMAKYTDAIITINQEDYEIAKRKFYKAKLIKKIQGVGLNTRKFGVQIKNEEKQRLKQSLDIKDNDIVLTYVAELNDNKNQTVLINTMKKLVNKNMRYKLLLIGQGPNKDKYQDEINKKGLKDNIKLLGYKKDIPLYLSITNIYVASSIREGLGLNIAEAMYMKLPIVATMNRGHKELVVNNKNGFLIEKYNDYDEFALKINQISNDKNMQKKFCENSKELSKKFELENIIEDMCNFYENEIKAC